VAGGEKRRLWLLEPELLELGEPFGGGGQERGQDRDGAPARRRLGAAYAQGLLSGGGVGVCERDARGFADAHPGVAQERDREPFLHAAGAGEQGLVLAWAEPVVFGLFGWRALERSERVRERLSLFVGE